MASSSSSSSRTSTRRSVHGVPTRCWCGHGIKTWASETKDNRFRRFYRCEIAVQRQNESHLFKWVDEAILDEVNIVDEKIFQLANEVKRLTTNVSDKFESHRRLLEEREQAILSQIKDNDLKIAKAIDDAAKKLKEEFVATLKSTKLLPQNNTNGTAFNIAVAVLVIGAMSCLYIKF